MSKSVKRKPARVGSKVVKMPKKATRNELPTKVKTARVKSTKPKPPPKSKASAKAKKPTAPRRAASKKRKPKAKVKPPSFAKLAPIEAPPPSAAPMSAAPPSLPSVALVEEPFDAETEVHDTQFYLHRWGRIGLRDRAGMHDDFGYDPVWDKRVGPVLNLIYDRYFRVSVDGAEHLPPGGRCLLVANHSGQPPWDGLMLRMAVRRETQRARDLRWLIEDFVVHFPYVGMLATRLGAVRACQENAEKLLDRGELVAVFPEGIKGVGKLYKERYRLQRFGRGGFVKLAIRTRTPIIPVAIVGAEEMNPLLFRIEGASKVLGIPFFPITPGFPLLGPVGLMPAPTKWKISFGEPIDFGTYGNEVIDDDVAIGRLSERVRSTIQSMLDRSVAERQSVFFG